MILLLLLGLSGQQGAARDDASAVPEVIVGEVGFDEAELARILKLSPLPDPPPDPTNAVYEDPDAAHLGRWLFFDARLSGNGTISCATCHEPGRSFTDGIELGAGIAQLERHTMSLWNTAYNRWFFWDGRADSLWSQALKPLEDPREHAGNRLAFAHLIASDDDLRRGWEEVFGPFPDLSDGKRFPPAGRPVDLPGQVEEGAEPSNHPHATAWRSMSKADQRTVDRVFVGIGKAIAAYERLLVSRRAPFDVFVEGLHERDPLKQRMLTDDARRGLKLFLGKANCHVCHAGPNFTDREFHNNRVPPTDDEFSMDLGRFRGIELVMSDPFNAAGPYSDDPDGPATTKVRYLRRMGHNYAEFKTPTLRNVARTAPYMHQGQFAQLPDVLHYYSTLEGALPTHHSGEKILQILGLTDDEKADLIAFLEALTDEGIPPELLGPPDKPYAEETHGG